MPGKFLTCRRARIRGITGATVCCDWVLRLCAAIVYCYCVRLLRGATARGYCVLLLRAATAPNPAAGPCCCCLLLLPAAAPWCYSLVPLSTGTPCRCLLPLLPAAAPCCYSLLLLLQTVSVGGLSERLFRQHLGWSSLFLTSRPPPPVPPPASSSFPTRPIDIRGVRSAGFASRIFP